MKKQKSERGRELAELRLSGAAGYHGKHRKDRRNAKRNAVTQSREDG